MNLKEYLAVDGMTYKFNFIDDNPSSYFSKIKVYNDDGELIAEMQGWIKMVHEISFLRHIIDTGSGSLDTAVGLLEPDGVRYLDDGKEVPEAPKQPSEFLRWYRDE